MHFCFQSMHKPYSIALIVDDEDDICFLLSIYLRRFFEEVRFAQTLSEGLRLATQLQPELLVLDNNLPDGIGIQQIPEFRQMCKRILVISAMNNLGEQAIQAGADHFLAKPVSFQDIEEFIKIKKRIQ